MTKLQEYLDKYKKKLNLIDYYIDYIVVDDEHWISDNDNGKSVKRKVDYYAQVQKNGHKKFTIIFNKSAIHNDLKDTVIHELIHILLWDTLEFCELFIKSSDFCDNHINSTIDKLCDKEHKVIEKIIGLIK